MVIGYLLWLEINICLQYTQDLKYFYTDFNGAKNGVK